MIRSGLKLLARDTAIYGLAGGVSRFLMLLALPIVANNLSTEEFGVWALLVIVGNVVAALLIFGMDSAVVRYYYDDDSHEYRLRVFSTGLLFQAALSAAVVCLLSLAAGQLLRALGLERRYQLALWIVLATAPAMVLGQFAQNWFRWTFQRVRFLKSAIGLGALTLGLLFYFVQIRSGGLYGVVLVTAVAQWVVAAISLWWCRDFLRWRISRHLLRGLATFGFPMMLVGLAAVFLGSMDRLFLAHYVSPVELGIYSFGQRLSVIMVVAVTAFQAAFGPFSFSVWEKPEAPSAFARFQTYYIAAAGTMALLLCAFGKVLVLLLGSTAYARAERVLPLLVFGSLVYGLYSFAGLGVFYGKRSVLNLAALACGVAAAALADVLLAPRLSGLGVALGFALGNVALVAAGYLFSRRLYQVEFRILRDLLLLGVLALLLWATEITVADSLLADALVKGSVGVALFVGAVFLVSVRGDRAAAVAYVRSLIPI